MWNKTELDAMSRLPPLPNGIDTLRSRSYRSPTSPPDEIVLFLGCHCGKHHPVRFRVKLMLVGMGSRIVEARNHAIHDAEGGVPVCEVGFRVASAIRHMMESYLVITRISEPELCYEQYQDCPVGINFPKYVHFIEYLKTGQKPGLIGRTPFQVVGEPAFIVCIREQMYPAYMGGGIVPAHVQFTTTQIARPYDFVATIRALFGVQNDQG